MFVLLELFQVAIQLRRMLSLDLNAAQLVVEQMIPTAFAAMMKSCVRAAFIQRDSFVHVQECYPQGLFLHVLFAITIGGRWLHHPAVPPAK